MQESRLVLKDSSMVALGLIAAPVAGLLAYWMCLIGYGLVTGNPSLLVDLLLLPWIFIVGLPVCFFVEAVVAVPLLMGFNRYHWSWLNSWTASAGGAALGAVVWFLFDRVVPKPANYNPHLWFDVALPILGCAVVGLVSTLVFRAIAVRTAAS